MTFSNINEAIKDDEELAKFMGRIEPMQVRLPALVDNILKMVSDGSEYSRLIKTSNKIALCKLCRSVVARFGGIEAFGGYEEVKKACKFSRQEIYYIKAAKGDRIATKGEIKCGAIGLYVKMEYAAGDKAFRMLHILAWILYGYESYLYRIGYGIKWDVNGDVITPLYDIITAAAKEIEQAIGWYKSKEYEKAVKITNKIAKAYSKIYPDSADDEIKEVISISQIVKDIIDRFRWNLEDKDYRRAQAIAINYSNRTKPTDIAFLREQYKRYGESEDVEKDVHEVDKSVEKMCIEIRIAMEEGRIKKDKFVLDIIKYAETSCYKVSLKQYSILNKTYSKLDETEDEDSSSDGTDIERDNYSGIGDILEI